MPLQTKTWETGDYAYKSWSNGYKIHLTLTEESTSIDNNTSVVSYRFWISNGKNNNFYDNTWSWSISIGGHSIAINNFNFYVYPYEVTQTIASGQITVTHNSNGSLNMPFNVSIPNVKASNAYAPPAMSLSGTWALTNIPRAATLVSTTPFSDTSNPTITYSNPAGNSATLLAVCICNDAGDIVVGYRDISKTESSYTFPLTDAEISDLLDEAAGNPSLSVVFVLCSTVGGVTEYRSLRQTMTIGDVSPILTVSVLDINDKTIELTGDPKKLIKYHSTARAEMIVEAQNDAVLDWDTFIIKNGGVPAFGSDSNVFSNVESNVFEFSAADNRGYVGRATATPTMINYVNLTCNIENTKPDASGNMTVRCNGSFFNGNFGKYSNDLGVTCHVADANGTPFHAENMTVSKSGNRYDAYATFTIPDFDYRATYIFECVAEDLLEIVSSQKNSVKSTPVFHWSGNDFVFEVPVTFNAGTTNGAAVSPISDDQTVDGDLNVTGDLRLKGSGNYGNTLRFGDGNYCYITEPTDDVMTIKASSINLEANNVKVYGNPIPVLATGVWTPTLSSSAVSSYSTQYGWYSKMGQTVSVGFNIKATCRSGYNSTLVTISGLPFSPMYSSAGGGMCSGAYVSAGFTFQCFVAETDGSITTRVQACNNTSTANLSTSKSGCWYPSGGGDITISGTITYIANS